MIEKNTYCSICGEWRKCKAMNDLRDFELSKKGKLMLLIKHSNDYNTNPWVCWGCREKLKIKEELE